MDVAARFRRGRRFGPASTSLSAPAPRLLEGVTCLVIEDDSASARLMRALLRLEGADVHVASDVVSAHRLLTRLRPRVALVDLVLPGISGLLFVRQIKSQPSTRDIVAIAVSAMNGPETERLALDAGCAAYIRKPIDVTTFAASVRHHLNEAS